MANFSDTLSGQPPVRILSYRYQCPTTPLLLNVFDDKAAGLKLVALHFKLVRLSQQQKSHIMASDTVFVLPGDSIDPSLIPSHPKKPLRLGPGLRHVPPNDIIPTLAGQLVTDRQKNAIRVENARGRVRVQFLWLMVLH